MSNWNDSEAKAYCEMFEGAGEDLALRVYTSRLLGRDPGLVLHGGGNTSVKTVITDDLGEATQVLCVKGSGWDLGDIEPPGLPAVVLEPLLKLRQLNALSDEAMVRNTRRHLMDPSAPNPSVETLLHAFLPHKFIDHTHSDAVLALADQPNAEEVLRSIYGEQVGIVPYIMPGFQLAKLAAEVYEAQPDVVGLVLINHGIFSFGATAKESYERMIALVAKAEEALQQKLKTEDINLQKKMPSPTSSDAQTLANLRGLLNAHPESPGKQVLHLRRSAAIAAFLDCGNLADISQRGPATPDHVIRTKQCPLILDVRNRQQPKEKQDYLEAELNGYVNRYHQYFQTQITDKGVEKQELHPLPIVFLIPGLGLVTAGKDHKAAKIAADIYERTIAIIQNAEAFGRYQPLNQSHLFDMEYWSLEQAKLKKQKRRRMDGKVAVVSGAAGGLGAAIAHHLASQGCHLVITDIQPEQLNHVAAKIIADCRVPVIAKSGDLTKPDMAEELVQIACLNFGGLDYVIANAGKAYTAEIASASRMLEESLQINLMAQQYLAAAAVDCMKMQGTGGCLLFTASKAAFNPGSGFGPYNIAKAGMVALMKQYAIEYASAGIRSLAINPDRVRTPLFDPKLLANRAAARGLSTDDYFKANLLGREVYSRDVAEACAFLLTAEKSTGTFFTVDGGNLAASPR